MAHPFQSNTVGSIFKALAEAQAQIQNPTKNAKNPHFKSTYTTLDETLNVAREALSAVGICIIQRTFMTDSLLMLETVLGHNSGEELSSHYPVIAVPYKPQDGLSALTYARRGALCAMIGIAGEDDDGNHANKVTTIAPQKPEINEKASAELLTEMTKGIEECNTEDDLTVWTLSNKGNKSKLTLTDQALITRTYKSKLELVKGMSNG